MPLGVIGSFARKHEKRLPLHPAHLPQIPAKIRQELILEIGYGQQFGYTDAQLEPWVKGFASRQAILQMPDPVIVLKPAADDFLPRPQYSLTLGWPHCVQQQGITQNAIDRQLSIFAFESIFDETGYHPFWANSELAGYAAVLHSFELKGWLERTDLKVVMMGKGTVSRGVQRALRQLGVSDLCILGRAETASPDLSNRLQAADVVINAILQNPLDPVVFIEAEDYTGFKPDSLILDISCDEGMGFPGAVPTDFDKPMRRFGHVDYYAVDHTPNLFWEEATQTVSEALIPYLEIMHKGQAALLADPILGRCFDLLEGQITNPTIWRFQKRSEHYPHGYI